MLSLILGSFLQVSAATAAAPDVPTPAAHPANVFLHGEEARIAIPEDAREQARRWRALDDVLLELLDRLGIEGSGTEVRSDASLVIRYCVLPFGVIVDLVGVDV